MSLTTQIEAYAGSATSYSTIVTQALADGIVDVVTKVIALRPDMAPHFSKMEVVTGDTGVTLDYSLPVTFCSRDGSPCVSGQAAIKDKYENSASLSYATKYDPIFYIDNAYYDPRVMIKPDPTPTEVGYVTKVTIGTAVDNTGVISYFPKDFIPLVVKYASIRLLQAKIETLRGILPTDLDITPVFGIIADIDLTTDLTNTTGLIYDLDVELTALSVYIDTDEDIELASTKMSEIKLKFDMIKSELEDKMSVSTVKERELLGNINKNMQAYSAKIQKHMQEYMMYMEKIKMISAEYSSAFDAIGGQQK